MSKLAKLKAEISDGVTQSTSKQAEETVYTVVGLLAHPQMGKQRKGKDPRATYANGWPTDVPTYVEIRMVRTKTHPVPALEDYFPHRIARTFVQFGEDMRFLGNPFHIFFCLNSFLANEHLNRAVASLTADIEPEPRKWPGLVLVLKLAGHGCGEDYVNFAEDDVLDVREYFAFFR